MKKLTKQISFINRKKLKTDNIRHPLEEHKRITYLSDLVTYNKIATKNITTPLYKFFLNNIIYFNNNRFVNNTVVNLQNKKTFLKIS